MKIAAALFGLMLLASTPPAHSKTYLASIGSIKLSPGEGIWSFKLKSWGVEYLAVCRIPSDWEITAGSMGPGGRLEGSAGHGTSMVRASDSKRLRDFVLIRFDGPVQKHDIVRGPGDVLPATFKGVATVEAGDRSRTVRLTFENIRLTPARNCLGSI